MLALLLPGLSKGFSSFQTFLASKHTIALRLVGAAIPSAPAALPAKGGAKFRGLPCAYCQDSNVASQMQENKCLFPGSSSREIGHRGSCG